MRATALVLAALAAGAAACMSASDPADPPPSPADTAAPAAPDGTASAAPAAPAAASDPAPGPARPGAASPALRPNRAWDGAPPAIPHASKDYAFDQCLECHGVGDGAGGELVAAPTPHPELVHCRSCHVPLTEEVADFRPSQFQPFVWPELPRAHAEAPKAVPHPATLREDCVVCHTSPNLPEHLRTRHPERRACTQCHVAGDAGWPGPRPRDAWTGGQKRVQGD